MNEKKDILSAYRLLDSIQYLAGILSIITSIITIFNSNTSTDSSSHIWTIASVSLFSVLCVLLIFKLRISSKKRVGILATQMNSFVSDMTASLILLDKKHLKGEVDDDTVDREMQNVLRSACDMLSQVFTLSTGKEINACYKQIRKATCAEIKEKFPNYSCIENDAFVFTLARNKNSRSERNLENEENIISMNTDFENIFLKENENSYFYVPNLKKYARNHDYKNSSINYEKGLYNATIVIPVCFNEKEINISNKTHKESKNTYNIIGFICVDSKTVNAFRVEYKHFQIDLIKIIARNLYYYNSVCKKYYKSVQ